MITNSIYLEDLEWDEKLKDAEKFFRMVKSICRSIKV